MDPWGQSRAIFVDELLIPSGSDDGHWTDSVVSITVCNEFESVCILMPHVG